MKHLSCLLALAALLGIGSSCEKRDSTFRIDLVKYLDNSYTSAFEDSLQKGLQSAGLVEGKDYHLRARSAQGDMATLGMLIDAASSSRADLLITFQAPTLYAAIQRAPDTRKMFTLLQNPFILGAGASDSSHLPNLAGVYMVTPFEELLDLIARCEPAIRKIGTIFDPGNDDSVFRKDELVRLAAERNIEVVSVPYTTQGEITLSCDALMAESPQAVIHMQDPAQDLTFPALFKSASSQKIPVFSLVFNMEKIGASIACSTDRTQIGDRFAGMVARVIKGEDPSAMPFESDRDLKKRYGWNQTAAQSAKIKLPVERLRELAQ